MRSRVREGRGECSARTKASTPGYPKDSIAGGPRPVDNARHAASDNLAAHRRSEGKERMKRSVTAVIVIAALLIPASASAAGKKYVGEFDKGGKVSFKLAKQRDGDKVVKRLRWSGVPISCSDGDHTWTVRFAFPIKVKRGGVFGYSFQEGAGNIMFAGGEVHRRRAQGHVAVRGRVHTNDGVRDGCRTIGPRARAYWHAKRV
jgi:hypothetical protein